MTKYRRPDREITTQSGKTAPVSKTLGLTTLHNFDLKLMCQRALLYTTIFAAGGLSLYWFVNQ